MSARDDFTTTPAAAAAYESAHGESWEYEPAFPLGSGNVPRLPHTSASPRTSTPAGLADTYVASLGGRADATDATPVPPENPGTGVALINTVEP